MGDHATNMPSTVWYANGNVIRDNVKYKYDACGNILEIRENGKLSARYEYDLLNRLVREDNKKFGKTWIYTYDNCGNITSKQEFTFTLRATELLEELESAGSTYRYEGDRLTEYNGKIITYDGYGNPVKYKGETLEWEYGKRLKKYGEKTYGYDGLGRRVKKGETAFTYDNNGRLIKQSNGIEFIYDVNGISGLKLENRNYVYRKNAQGDITHILNTSGESIAEYDYDAWGNSRVIKDTDGIGELNPFRYRGYYYDVETGLYYLITRYYDPEVGRFISQDDVSYLDPEHINGLNLYAYCGNNPVMGYDPDGTWDWKKFWVGLGLVLTAVAAVAVSVMTFGAATPLAMTVVAWVTLGAGVLTGINGIATMVEAGTGYNFVRDGVFQGNETAYNWYAGITEGVAIIGTAICGGWRKANAPRIKAYKNVGKASFTKTLSDTSHMNRTFQQSILLQQQIIKYGKMVKESKGVYKFLAPGAFRVGFEGNVHNSITWKLVIDVVKNVIMHIGPF